MKKYAFIVSFLVLLIVSTGAVHAQNVAVKTNLLYGATTTPNLSVEMALGIKTTLDLQGTYNPFTFHDNKKLRHWSVQPELRFWLCEKFTGGVLRSACPSRRIQCRRHQTPAGDLSGSERSSLSGTCHRGRFQLRTSVVPGTSLEHRSTVWLWLYLCRLRPVRMSQMRRTTGKRTQALFRSYQNRGIADLPLPI